MSRDENRELMHRVLDGDASVEEQKALLDRMGADPLLKKEYEDLAHAVRVMNDAERRMPPPRFTAEVMRKLPRRNVSLVQRMRDVLHDSSAPGWNLAAASRTAALAVSALVVIILLRTGGTERSIPVHISFSAPTARQVAVAGSFNKWSVVEHIMKKQKNGVWNITLELKPGTYSYQFVIDGKTWTIDPRADLLQDDGFGTRNTVVRVSA